MKGKKKRFSLYGGVEPADLPRYTRVDAARATRIPVSTIDVWVDGMTHTSRTGQRRYLGPVIQLPDRKDPRLSFNNILEANVLRVLRRVHDIKLKIVRTAVQNAKRDHGIDRLLLHPNLVASGPDLFLDLYFDLIDLSNSQQLYMRSLLEHSLTRIDRDEDNRLVFFPSPHKMAPQARPILVSPYVAFGSPIVERRGVSTAIIRSRIDAGEKREDVMADYDLTGEEFDEALYYELAA